MKYLLLGLVSLFLSTHSLAQDEYTPREIEWLQNYIQETDFAARLSPISVVILDDLSGKQENDYYQYVTTFQVLDTYKGKLPEYILVPSFGELHKKYNTKRYYIKSGKLVVITGLCKGKENYYFPETHSTYSDIPIVRNAVEQAGKVATSSKGNLCNQ